MGRDGRRRKRPPSPGEYQQRAGPAPLAGSGAGAARPAGRSAAGGERGAHPARPRHRLWRGAAQSLCAAAAATERKAAAMIALLLLLLQGPQPTVGDTIWIERVLGDVGGAVVRPQPWSLGELGEQ